MIFGQILTRSEMVSMALVLASHHDPHPKINAANGSIVKMLKTDFILELFNVWTSKVSFYTLGREQNTKDLYA